MRPMQACLAIVLLCSGCLSSEGTVAQRITRSEHLIQIEAGGATTALLLSVEPAKRPAVANRIHAIAVDIHVAAADPNADGFDLAWAKDALAESLAGSNEQDRPLITYLVNTVGGLLEEWMRQQFADLTDPDKRTAIKSLARGVSQGVIDATAVYGGR